MVLIYWRSIIHSTHDARLRRLPRHDWRDVVGALCDDQRGQEPLMQMIEDHAALYHETFLVNSSNVFDVCRNKHWVSYSSRKLCWEKLQSAVVCLINSELWISLFGHSLTRISFGLFDKRCKHGCLLSNKQLRALSMTKCVSAFIVHMNGTWSRQ